MKATQVIARANALALVFIVIALATEASSVAVADVFYTLSGLIWIGFGIYTTIKLWN